jgi:hypothetical protein
MSWRLVKLIYFATICLPPPFMLVLYPAIFLGYIHVSSSVLTYYTFYFWFGGLILLIDLWLSKRPQDMKIIWTVLLVFVGIVTLPIYWFRFVLREYQTST